MMLEGEVDGEMLKKIEAYVINPIESRVKDLCRLAVDQNVQLKLSGTFCNSLRCTYPHRFQAFC